MPHLAECIHDGETLVSNFEDAYHKIKTKKAKEILKGLKMIGKDIKQFKTYLSDCKGIKADLAKLEKMAHHLTSPMSFVYHVGKDIIVNHTNIIHDVEKAIKDGEAHKYLDLGRDIGRALALLLLGEGNEDVVSTLPTQEEIVENNMFLY